MRRLVPLIDLNTIDRPNGQRECHGQGQFHRYAYHAIHGGDAMQ